jgi:hypothetical protein
VLFRTGPGSRWTRGNLPRPEYESTKKAGYVCRVIEHKTFQYQKTKGHRCLCCSCDRKRPTFQADSIPTTEVSSPQNSILSPPLATVQYPTPPVAQPSFLFRTDYHFQTRASSPRGNNKQAGGTGTFAKLFHA